MSLPRVLAIVVAISALVPALARGAEAPAKTLRRFENLPPQDLVTAELRMKQVLAFRREAPLIIILVDSTRESESNDLWNPLQVIHTTPNGLKSLLQATASCRSIRSPRAAADSVFYVEMRVGAGRNAHSHRVYLNQDEMSGLWAQWWRAVAGEDDLRLDIAWIGRAYGLIRIPRPVDEIDKVSLRYSSFRPVGESGDYIGFVDILNVSKEVLHAPVSLILWARYVDSSIVGPVPSGRTYLAGDGLKCWPGQPYYDLAVGESFEPGESVRIQLRVRNEHRGPLEFAAMLIAGPGSR